jgi:hypothetical protein
MSARLWFQIARWAFRRYRAQVVYRTATVLSIGKVASLLLNGKPETILLTDLRPGDGIEIRALVPKKR